MCKTEPPEKDEDHWRFLEDSFPVRILNRGADPKGVLEYNPPGWSSAAPDPKILSVSLQVISNGVLLESVDLNFKSHYILGSTDECDFVYKNPQVSRKHFVLHFTRTNSLVILDLNSKCGTSVNHARLAPERYYHLSLGDQIRIGKPGLSSRTYVVAGESIFSELEPEQAAPRARENDVDRLKKFRKIEKEIEAELRSTRVEGSYYDTNLYLDEYDAFFDERKPKAKRKQAPLSKTGILSALLGLQRREIELLNAWYALLRETRGAEPGPESSIEEELERVMRKQLEQDRARIQRDLDSVREELERNFKLLRVASF